MLNKYHGGRIQVSTDSSSPGQYPVYGTYLHSPQLNKMVFTHLYFPKGENLPYNASDLVPNPFGHPVSEGFTFGEVSNYKGDVTMKMTLNNLFVYNETVKQVEEIVKCHNELLQTVIPADFYSVLMSMEEMFLNPDNAINIYEKNVQLYNRFGGGTKDLVNNQVITQFFDLGQ
jgi:hypothetical protein